jgi:hypothetical protein
VKRAAAASWKHEVDQNDGDLLTYSENGDVSAFWAAPIGEGVHSSAALRIC